MELDTFYFSSNTEHISELTALVLKDKYILSGWVDKKLCYTQSISRENIANVSLDFSKIPCKVFETRSPLRHISSEGLDENSLRASFDSVRLPHRSHYAKVKADKIKSTLASSVYFTPKKQYKEIKSNFQVESNFHYSTALIQFVQDEQDVLLVSILNNELHCVLQKEGQFHFYNAFEFFTQEDLLYHILLIRKTFDLSDSFPIKLGGMLDTSSQMFKFLENYLPTLQLLNGRSYGFSLGNNLDTHLYLSQYACQLCE